VAQVGARWRSVALTHPTPDETVRCVAVSSSVDLLRRAWAAYDRGDVDAFAACLTDDWREYGPDGPDGGSGTLDDERLTMELHRSAFPDKHTEIHHVIGGDDRPRQPWLRMFSC
jgi:SnoaL-like domain